jgi:hypothetical protein
MHAPQAAVRSAISHWQSAEQDHVKHLLNGNGAITAIIQNRRMPLHLEIWTEVLVRVSEQSGMIPTGPLLALLDNPYDLPTIEAAEQSVRRMAQRLPTITAGIERSERRESRKPECPVVLGQEHEPVYVNGKSKPCLKRREREVIAALVAAYPTGVKKDALPGDERSARTALDRLRSDPDWEAVIFKPGRTRLGYRLIPPPQIH